MERSAPADYFASAALGTWALSDSRYWGPQSPGVSLRTLERALDLGIRHIDTAQVYGSGAAEQLISRLLRSNRHHLSRDELRIDTKIHTYHPASVEKLVDTSLRRIGCEYLDTVYLHWPGNIDDLEGVYEALQGLLDRGKIRRIGACNLPLRHLRAVCEVSEVTCCQTPYSLLWRYSEHDIIPYCRDHGIAVLGYSPLAQGFLAGRTLEELLSRAPARGDLALFSPEQRTTTERIIAEFSRCTREIGASPVHTALKWIEASGLVDTIILGSRSPAQLEQALGFRELMIPDEVMERLQRISAERTGASAEQMNLFGHRWK